MPEWVDAVTALGGAQAVAWLSVIAYAITWLVPCLPRPSRRSSRLYRRLHAVMNLIAANVRNARNRPG